MEIYNFGNEDAPFVLLQMVDHHDLEAMEKEISLLNSMTDRKYLLLACKTDDWNRDLSPWEAPAVFGDEPFAGKARDTLAWLQKNVLPRYPNKAMMIGGYSLGGLFALWAASQTGRFHGVAAASPSVWFPRFLDYAREHMIQAPTIYLSLGDREEKTSHPLMSTVGSTIRELYQLYAGQKKYHVTLEWNPGNHFKNPALRTAKAFAWCLNNEEKLVI